MQRMASNRRSPAPGRARRDVLGRAAAVLAAAALPCRFASAAHVVRAWPAGRPAPPLDVVDLAGRPWRLEALAGRVVVLNFWATWCEPCRLEMPSLDAMAARRRGDGVVVAAVNYKEAAEVVERFVERSRFKSQVLLDSDGDATVAWTPRVFPTTVLIARNSVPAQVVVGELDWEGAEAKMLIDSLVAVPGRA
jgi:thiol-disulfide isomerase/thioredoxin